MIKQKTTKPCQNKGCDNIFRLFNSTDKYCSPACTFANAPEQKPRQSIRKVSKKSRVKGLMYTRKRKAFMNKPENKYCAVYPQNLATDVHHKKGRVGMLFLHIPLWLAVSRVGHIWIHNNPKEAIKKGWLIKSTSK